MPDKPNMYRGLRKETEMMKEKMKQSAVLHHGEDGVPDGIPMYLADKAKEIRDDVASLKGKLEFALDGLEKTSNKRKYYSEGVKWCEVFLSETKEDWR